MTGNDKLVYSGAGGAIIAAVCCFTPLLVWLLPAIGLAGWLAWIDVPLWAALILFLAFAGTGLMRRARAPTRIRNEP